MSTEVNPFSRWTGGDQILYREVYRGKVWTARPVIVIQDEPDWIGLYLPKGTHWKLPSGSRDRFFNYLQMGVWSLVEVTWDFGDTLILHQPGSAYAVHVMWEVANRDFIGWYVNLQEPLRRTTLGFDFMDQELDIFVEPDLSGWSWKDEEHLLRAQRDGRFSEAEAAAIRAEGERVIELVKQSASPFCDGWETWQPPASWTLPQLPEGWDLLESG